MSVPLVSVFWVSVFWVSVDAVDGVLSVDAVDAVLSVDAVGVLGGRRGLRLLVVGALGRRRGAQAGEALLEVGPELGIDAARQLLDVGLGALDGGVGAAAAAVAGRRRGGVDVLVDGVGVRARDQVGRVPAGDEERGDEAEGAGSRIREGLPIGRRI